MSPRLLWPCRSVGSLMSAQRPQGLDNFAHGIRKLFKETVLSFNSINCSNQDDCTPCLYLGRHSISFRSLLYAHQIIFWIALFQPEAKLRPRIGPDQILRDFQGLLHCRVICLLGNLGIEGIGLGKLHRIGPEGRLEVRNVGKASRVCLGIVGDQDIALQTDAVYPSRIAPRLQQVPQRALANALLNLFHLLQIEQTARYI